jgi:Raf kinase inhibitor-like YbhB/YbcL family protein
MLRFAFFLIFLGTKSMAFELSSPAFSEAGTIPISNTCDGADHSPKLIWKEAPSVTKSFALICDDPDAPVGIWVHWVIYNIPATCHELPEAVPTNQHLHDGSNQGRNDFGKTGYGGPCPPRGTPHRYFFTLYALDVTLALDTSNATKESLENAMKGHIIAKTNLMGRYGR